MAEPTVVGYVDKSIFVQVDSEEIVVGTVSIPVTFNGLGVDGYSASRATVTLDHPDHDGCLEDLPLPMYIKTGDEHTPIGTLTCCTGCQPAPYVGD